MIRTCHVYKAESAGKQVIFVNPRGTSQTCSSCGQIVPKDLSVRIHKCSCGCSLDRDHNAAINILVRGTTSEFTPVEMFPSRDSLKQEETLTANFERVL